VGNDNDNNVPVKQYHRAPFKFSACAPCTVGKATNCAAAMESSGPSFFEASGEQEREIDGNASMASTNSPLQGLENLQNSGQASCGTASSTVDYASTLAGFIDGPNPFLPYFGPTSPVCTMLITDMSRLLTVGPGSMGNAVPREQRDCGCVKPCMYSLGGEEHMAIKADHCSRVRQ
jgi:hypothetical protein